MKQAFRHPPIAAKFPYILHGGDYNPEQWIKWKDTVWKEDMRLAKLAGINTLSIGIFAWSTLEPSEGDYHFEWLDEMMDLMAENDMAVVMATPSGARPAWLSQKYPEVLRVNADRTRNLHGGRHNHCLSSPVYREKTAQINARLAERYAKRPSLAIWHVSNEYGGECHCPLCQERFREFLRKRYGTLDALNAAWWTAFWSHTYTDWSQIESPSPTGETSTHGLNLSWKRFTTEQFVDFYLCETAPLKKFAPSIPCTTNLMGTYPGVDYFRLAEVLDVASWDNYPHWRGTDEDTAVGSRVSFLHDLTRSLKGKPFMMMESSPSATNWQPVAKLRRPGVHALQSLQAVAHGADTVQYFQFRKGRGAAEKFHGAVVDHEGTEYTRVFHEVADVGKRLKDLEQIVGTFTPASVALIYDWNVRWALEDAKGFLQSKTNYESAIINHYRAFWRLGASVDVIDSTRPLDGYSIVSAPMLYMLRPGFAERITAFVESGGTFVASYITGYVDENDLCFLDGFPGPLKDALGIWCEEIDALYPNETNMVVWNGKTYKAFDFCEIVHCRGAKRLATYGKDFYAGQPALTINHRGKGKAYFIAARTEQAFLNDFYASLVKESRVHRALDANLPEGVTAQERSDGKTRSIFVMNFTPFPKNIILDSGKKYLAPWEVWITQGNNEA
ncbi:MAG: beta-galactosidase [Treponema sp.]|jgi:beta-galactosidase|nr:beta-galactosidase [Treponema sp.]